jgi:hypothetical protein
MVSDFAGVKVISLTIDNFYLVKKVDIFFIYIIEKQIFMFQITLKKVEVLRLKTEYYFRI